MSDKSVNPLVSHFENIDPLSAKKDLENLQVKVTWYGGRRYFLPGKEGSLSFEQVSGIAKVLYSTMTFKEQMQAINNVWKLNIKGNEAVKNRNIFTRLYFKLGQ